MRQKEDADELFLGDVVVSFNVYVLQDKEEMEGSEKTYGINMVLSENRYKVIKMFKKMYVEFVEDVQKYLNSYPDGRIMLQEYDQLVIENGGNANIIPEHPVAKYVKYLPKSIPPEMSEKGSYVKFIFTTGNPDAYKIDCTFLNNETRRFTIPSSVVPLLFIRLSNVLSF